ncbi:MAG: hypothetical protein LBV45_01105 [Xanthomonadaceae bacterium]|jgi:prefoldin subunit 5|nr:hypothetical protein [Xanthomonadaceae bacterium]
MNTNNVISEELSDVLDQFKLVKERLNKTIKEKHHAIERLNKERISILNTPLNADDYCALIHSDIDAVADRYLKKIAQRMREGGEDSECPRRQYPKHMAHIKDAIRKRDESEMSQYGVSMLCAIRAAIFEDRDGDGNNLTQGTATLFLRDQMKSVVTQAMELVRDQWPSKEAVPVKEQRLRLETIDREIEQLTGELDTLLQQVEEFEQVAHK